jgi:hypothetical protein
MVRISDPELGLSQAAIYCSNVRYSTIPNPLFGHHPLLGQSHIVTPYIETQPGLKLGRSVTPAPCTARGITATQLYQPLVSAMVLLECIVLKIWLKCIKITM